MLGLALRYGMPPSAVLALPAEDLLAWQAPRERKVPTMADFFAAMRSRR